MKTAFHALAGCMYVGGATMFVVVGYHYEAMNSIVAAAMGASATAMWSIPSYLIWMEKCWVRAEGLARSSAHAGTAAFVRELKSADQRHQSAVEAISRKLGATELLLSRRDDDVVRLEDKVLRVTAATKSRDPKTGRFVALVEDSGKLRLISSNPPAPQTAAPDVC